MISANVLLLLVLAPVIVADDVTAKVLVSAAGTITSLDDSDSCLMSLRHNRTKKYLSPLDSDTDLEADLYGSEQLGLLLVSAARHESVSDDTTALLRSFRPCAECKQHRRYGEGNDGGYVMCDDDMVLGQIKGAYSYGINGFDGWGNAVSEKFKIPVFEYDCTNPKVPQKCPSCDLRFNLECINSHSASPKAKFGTLSQHFQRNGHNGTSPASLLMKIDVEGAEWPVFAEEPAENLKKFREIIVEFHDLHQVNRHADFLKAVKNILNAGFVVEHIHGNNNGGLTTLGTEMIPKVLEVTYIQRPNAGPKCRDHSTLLPEDARNNVGIPELPKTVLPML